MSDNHQVLNKFDSVKDILLPFQRDVSTPNFAKNGSFDFNSERRLSKEEQAAEQAIRHFKLIPLALESDSERPTRLPNSNQPKGPTAHATNSLLTPLSQKSQPGNNSFIHSINANPSHIQNHPVRNNNNLSSNTNQNNQFANENNTPNNVNPKKRQPSQPQPRANVIRSIQSNESSEHGGVKKQNVTMLNFHDGGNSFLKLRTPLSPLGPLDMRQVKHLDNFQLPVINSKERELGRKLKKLDDKSKDERIDKMTRTKLIKVR